MDFCRFSRTARLVGLAAAILQAQPGPAPPPADLIPDRLILTWAGDPATSMAVTWRTGLGAAAPVVEWAPADHGPVSEKNVRRAAGVTEELSSGGVVALYHSVRLTGLSPATLYMYRAGDGRWWSEWNHFKTADRGPGPLTFVYFADAQHGLMSLWPRVIRTAWRWAPDARFLLHAGDLINNRGGAHEIEWGHWFAAAGWIFRTVPSLPAAGNHEYPPRGTGPKVVTPHWRQQFTLPENGVAGLEETNYFLDIQGVRVVVLNSNEKQKDQADWLDGVLRNQTGKWVILVFHHPLLSSMKGQDNRVLRETWQPVIDRHSVDLVFTGDEHSYLRSKPATGSNYRSGRTIYVVSVGGPQMYQVETRPWTHKSAEDTQLFQIIRVDGNRLSYESRTARGEIYDSFTLTKTPRGNRLKDGPGMAERRRPR